MDMPANLYIIEDHSLTRQALQKFLGQSDDWHVSRAVSSGEQALVDPLHDLAALVIIDLSLPDMNGIQLVETLHARYPTLPFLILSSYQDEGSICRSLKAGAKGYVIKDEPLELILGIEQLLAGHTYLSPRAQEQLPARNTCAEQHSALAVS